MTNADKKTRMALFEAAAKIWMDRLPWLKIVHWTTAYNPKAVTTPDRITIEFITGDASFSPLGRAQSQKGSVVSLGDNPLTTYVHEIGHSKSFPAREVTMTKH